MGRLFEFSRVTQNEARLRQWGLCARCGESLDDLWENAHHVIPNQIGRAGKPAHGFLRSVDNCVILCEDCHSEAHAYGRFRFGPVALPDFYRFSHGNRGLTSHIVWRRRIQVQWKNYIAR